MPPPEEPVSVVRDGKRFGPLARQAIEQLLETGRLLPTDQVVLVNGTRLAAAEFVQGTPPLSAPPVSPKPRWREAPGPQTVRTPDSQAELLLVRGGKRFKPMSQAEVAALQGAGRLQADDLLAVQGGPWMRALDFFATPEPELASLELPAEWLQQTSDTCTLPDAWFARIQGIHSCNLRACDLRSLWQAQIIDRTTLVTHAHDSPAHWRPLEDVPALRQVWGGR